ncbi:putative c2h2 transcription factor protein, partial [Botrytis fragariae]
ISCCSIIPSRLVRPHTNIWFLCRPSWDPGDEFSDSLPFDGFSFAFLGLERCGTTFNYEPSDAWNPTQQVSDPFHTMQQLRPERANSVPVTQVSLPSLSQGSTDNQAIERPINLAQNTEDEERPHRCTARGCNVRGFKKQTDLRRHQGTHGNPLFFCPVTTCKAHTKGFKRKDNLREHRKRVHDANARASDVRADDLKQALRAASSEDEEMEDSSSVQVPANMQNGSMVDAPAKSVLLAKLVELRTSRERFIFERDEEIKAVETTLSLIKTYSH